METFYYNSKLNLNIFLTDKKFLYNHDIYKKTKKGIEMLDDVNIETTKFKGYRQVIQNYKNDSNVTFTESLIGAPKRFLDENNFIDRNDKL